MENLLFGFDIAHRAVVDEFVNVLSAPVGYPPDAHSGLASRTRHRGPLFFLQHDTQTPPPPTGLVR
jgi:hypothetical protein